MKDKKVPKNILVKLPVKIGDTIMAAPVLRAIKEKYPESQLDVIMDELTIGLAGMMPYINTIHRFSKKKYSGPIGNYRCGRDIAKQKKYDLFICLPFSFSSALAGFFTNSKIRIGFNEEYRGFLFTRPIKRPEGMHIVEEFNYLFETFTKEKITFRPLNFLPKENNLIDFTRGKYLVLNIKSGPPSRSIPIDKSISLTEEILDNYPYNIILTGAPNEIEYVNQVKNHFQNEDRVIDMSGKTNLMELAYVISKSEIMVTTDSGNAHIANAVGTPTVVLFGATSLHRAYPYDQRISRTINNPSLPCLPCNKEYCRMKDNRCLATIGNAQVFSSIDSLISLKNEY
jgi:lipopolysaccharide heptosyltransferase II